MNPASLASNVPTPGHVRAVCAIPDPVVRNLRITQTYYLLSRAMTERTGDCANWCTFAVWASRQAGCTIRAEDIISGLERRFHGPGSFLHVSLLWRRLLRRGLLRPETVLGRIVKAVNTPFDAVERSSEAVARGNLKVFEEIGYEFARYLHAAQPSDFIAGLHAPLLRDAFANYELGLHSHDEEERAQRILLANLQIGLHEQTRLQPEIEAALNAPADTAREIGRRVLAAFGIVASLTPLVLLAGYALLPFSHVSRALARGLITDRLMTLEAAGTVLYLGDDLQAEVPALLRSPAVPELVTLFEQFEPTECKSCGAEDWSSLVERMHYILHLFQTHQYRTELLLAPFDPHQLREIEQNRLPDGIL
jgi:hypothetical protein